jgi:predicted AAA+ superfamily ATPase
MSVLETSFLYLRLPAWRRNPRKQAVKSPKIHMIDTGLACYLLGITEPAQLRHHPLRGALFESWVVSEVLKSRLHRGLPERMYHVRDAKGLEVDLVIEEGGRLTAVEVKSSSTVASDFFTSLSRLGDRVSDRQRHAKFDARIVYAGDTDQRRQETDVIAWHRLHARHW